METDVTVTQKRQQTSGPGLGASLPKVITFDQVPEIKQAEEGMKAASQEQEAAYARYQPAIAERTKALQGELDKPLPQAPQLERIPGFQPKQLTSQDMTLFAGIAMALAGLGTKAMRGDMAMALNAAGNAMRGFNEGNIQQADLELKQFRERADAITRNNKTMSEEYNAILANRSLSLQQKNQALEVAMHARNDEVGLATLKQNNYKILFDLAAKRVDANNQFALQGGRMVMQMQMHLDNLALRKSLAEQATQRVQSKPIFVQKPDGSMTQIVPQFDEAGQIANIPAGWKVIGTQAGSATRGGAQNARYAFNVTESFEQAATDLVNVSKMPAGTVLGSFAGMTGQSGEDLQRSLSTTLSRKITTADARMMQQVVSGLEMNMARALGGGYAQSSAGHLIEAYKQQIPKAGDSPVTTAMFLARVKQELGVLANAFQGHPGATPEWTKQMKDYVAEIDRSIPYTVPDVLHATSRGRQTISQQWRKLATEPVRMQLPSDIPHISSDAEYDSLPPGPFIDPEGRQRMKQ